MQPIPLPTEQAYSELQVAFDFFNERLFDNKLPPTLITFQREKRTEGYLSPKRFVDRNSGQLVDELAMNPAYFVIRSLKHTLSVIVHEQVHQWQILFGKPGRRRYHNKEWADMMEVIGLMPSDTGKPGGARTGECMSHYIISGGRFDVACAELLTRDFTVTWLDRFPAERPQPTAPAQPNHGKGYIDDLDEPDDLDEDHDGSVDEPEVRVHFDDLGALTEDLGKVGEAIEYPPEIPLNRSHRVKYRCTKCTMQVWGKPGLVVLCGAEDHRGQELVPAT